MFTEMFFGEPKMVSYITSLWNLHLETAVHLQIQIVNIYKPIWLTFVHETLKGDFSQKAPAALLHATQYLHY